MGVSLWVGERSWEVGAASFFHAFCSTVSRHLEPDGWGSVYPELMTRLYNGALDAKDAAKLRADLLDIREKLRAFPPGQIVWDIHNPAARPPWGDQISPHITSLANYFVTGDGEDLFEVFLQALDESEQTGEPLLIE